MSAARMPSDALAAAPRTWWLANRFLLLRRLSQLAVLLMFLSGPWWGVWVLRGNLSSSELLGTVPLSDPLNVMQVLASGHWPSWQLWLGLGLVAGFYALVSGRIYCSWVCPVNVVTDSAAWLRRRFGWRQGRPPAMLRGALVWAILAACAITGMTVWEWVNPVTMTHRALVFGGTTSLAVLAAVFFYDLLVAPQSWCGRLCPVGATYAWIGRKGLLKVSARHSSRCNDCADCYAVCPEPQVIKPALKGKEGATPVILDPSCTQCGRCVDVCATEVFTFTHRFQNDRD